MLVMQIYRLFNQLHWHKKYPVFWFCQRIIKLPLKYNLYIHIVPYLICLYVFHTAVHTDVRKILKCVLQQQDGRGLDSSDAGKRQLVVSCELNFWLDNVLLASTRRTLLNWLIYIWHIFLLSLNSSEDKQ